MPNKRSIHLRKLRKTKKHNKTKQNMKKGGSIVSLYEPNYYKSDMNVQFPSRLFHENSFKGGKRVNKSRKLKKRKGGNMFSTINNSLSNPVTNFMDGVQASKIIGAYKPDVNPAAYSHSQISK